MKDRPILFNGPMVRAILGGRKTQTRRVIDIPKWQNFPSGINEFRYIQPMHGTSPDGVKHGDQHKWRIVGEDWPDDAHDDLRCPYAVGDHLWVRETWAEAHHIEGRARAIYRATDPDVNDEFGVKRIWKPSIHMPRWACRITLEVTRVRVERLKDITYNDCLAEGIDALTDEQQTDAAHITETKERFQTLWNSVNARGRSWDGNPWVWVIEFERLPTKGTV